MTFAFSLGQATRGLTIRSRDSPKFAMARATDPIFSPSCGSIRTTTGPGATTHRLVLSVPAPGMEGSLAGGCPDAAAPAQTARPRQAAAADSVGLRHHVQVAFGFACPPTR